MSRTYLAECYHPDPTLADRPAVRLVAAAHESRGRGGAVEFLDGMLLPDDDVAFYRFSAQAPGAVAAVCAAAGVPVTRISEYVLVPGPVSAPAR